MPVDVSSVFSKVPLCPAPEVFGLVAAYSEDPHPNKVDLSVGAYRTDEGEPWVLPVVRSVEVAMADDSTLTKEYHAISGTKDFYEAAVRLFLGDDSPAVQQQRVTAVQTVGASGALAVGADFLNKASGLSVAYISDPGYVPHTPMFEAAGFEVRLYRYWKETEKTIDFNSMKHALQTAPPRSTFLLHMCGHNPTGVDPSREQWQEIAAIMKEKEHFPFFDGAYQGFATGDLDNDAWPARYFVSQGFELICTQSFSKSFGLYGDRVGTCIVVSANGSTSAAIRSQMELLVRRLWSNPPSHGAHIVTTVLHNPALVAEWKENVKTMASRVRLTRQCLYEKLLALRTPGTWEHIVQQVGMFGFLGLTVRQCEFLIQERHIYLLKNGRINICGVNAKNVDYVARSIYEAVTTITD